MSRNLSGVRRRGVQWGAIACFVCLALLLYDAERRVFADDVDLGKVINGIRSAHDRLLHIPGGIKVMFRLDVDQNKENPIFVWREGLDGVLCLRWPELRCTAAGRLWGSFKVDRAGNRTPIVELTEREGCYNFETQCGVGRDGDDLGQITNYRHAFSAIMGFPLSFQFFEEMDQHYVPNESFDTEYWLPSAFDNQYELTGQEDCDGVRCHVLERSGLDKIWVCADKGFAICKREYNFGVGKLMRERVRNFELVEVYDGTWFPMKQRKEEFKVVEGSHVPSITYTLNVKDLIVGKVQDADVRITLEKSVKRIEDQISLTIYEPQTDVGAEFEDTLRDSHLRPGSDKGLRLLMVLLSAALVLGAFLYRLRHKR